MAMFRQCLKFVNLISKTPLQYTDTRNIARWVSPTLRELKRRKDKLGPEAEKPRSSYIDWNFDAELHAFGKRLNESFDGTLLRQALTHRSYLTVKEPEIVEDNVSLVREGEEFIVNYVKEYLHEALPRFPEEGVNTICDHLLSEKCMAEVASHIGLKDITLCAEFPISSTTLAATLKSVIAALLHSSGENRASSFIRDFLITQLNVMDVNELWQIEEPVSLLERLLAEQNRPPIEPRLCNVSAKNTILAAYEVGLYCSASKTSLGSGWGETIETATEVAARNALARMFGSGDAMPALKYKQSPITSTNERMFASTN